MCLLSVNLMVTYQSRWTSRLVRFRKSAERRVPVGDVIDKCRSSEGFPRASSSSYMMVITMLMVQNYVFDDEDLLPSYGRGQPLM